MKDLFEIRCNAIYAADDTNTLVAKVELVFVHSDGMQYYRKGKVSIGTPVIRETRMVCDEEGIDRLLTDLQKWKLQFNQIKQNCSIINNIVTQLNTNIKDEEKK